MSTKTTVNIGLVGCGFMDRAHSNAFAKVNQFFELDARPVLKAVCARNPGTAEAFARNWGYESFETDWRALVRRDDIDLIDIASPNDTHAEIAIAAAEAGKMVMCEKPLSPRPRRHPRQATDRRRSPRPRRRRRGFPRPLRQPLARHIRSDPLGARPQGAIYARNQRRERIDLMGSARSAPPELF
jgi:hypothetical protein